MNATPGAGTARLSERPDAAGLIIPQNPTPAASRQGSAADCMAPATAWLGSSDSWRHRLYLGGEIVKPQGLVMPTGRAMGCAEQTEVVGGRPARVITSTLVTDHRAYGGHHRALFADHLALALRAFREVSQGARLEVTVDGRPRSQPVGVGGSPSPVADRAKYSREGRDAPGGRAADGTVAGAGRSAPLTAARLRSATETGQHVAPACPARRSAGAGHPP